MSNIENDNNFSVDGAKGITLVSSDAMKSIADQTGKAAGDAMDQGTKMIDEFRGAKTIEDIVALQTSFLHNAFSVYAEYVKRMSEIMMILPMEIAKQGHSLSIGVEC